MAAKKPTAKPVKPPRTRSPNYPALDLGTLVSKLPTVFSAIKRHPAGVETIAQSLGYKHTSSSGLLALGASRAFGLLEKVKGGAGATLKLSTLGLDLAGDYAPDSAEWLAAAKKAALLPPIHRELWNRYGATLPADDEIRRVLVRELRFNDNAAGPLIAQYKTTIAFAKLSDDDKIANGGSGPEHENLDDEPDAVAMNATTEPASRRTSGQEKAADVTILQAGRTRKLPVTLPSLHVAVLEVPYPMSAADFKALSNAIAMFEDALTKKPDLPPE